MIELFGRLFYLVEVVVVVKAYRQELTCSRRPSGYFTLTDDRAPSVTLCYPYTGTGRHSWCLSSSLSLSVGFATQDEALDVARSAPQGAHYYADVMHLLPFLGIKKGARAL